MALTPIRYILLDKQCVDLAASAINRPDMKGHHDVYNRVMPRDNIAVISFFENRQSGARLIVVNAHLHWDHEYKDVKVVQVAVLLEQLEKLCETYKSWPPLKESEKKLFRFANGDNPTTTTDGSPKEESDATPAAREEAPPLVPKPSMSYTDAMEIPTILCGDFNSLPHSGPYELISRGRLAPDHEDLEHRNYGSLTTDGIEHPFLFESAYARVNELPFTNYVSNFIGVVDYIWYAKNSLGVRGLLGGVEEAYVGRVPGFPNVHFPSDHLALMTEFGVKRRVGSGGQQQQE
jgi:CCR4-NOT transcription complex subunit 6